MISPVVFVMVALVIPVLLGLGFTWWVYNASSARKAFRQLKVALEDEADVETVQCPRCQGEVGVNATALDMIQHPGSYFLTLHFPIVGSFMARRIPGEEDFIVARCATCST